MIDIDQFLTRAQVGFAAVVIAFSVFYFLVIRQDQKMEQKKSRVDKAKK